MNEESAFFTQIFLIGVIPFLSYFLGVYIRNFAFPSAGSPSLKAQFLIAIPLSIGIISPLLLTLGSAISDTQSLSGYLVTIGVIMEHGMFMNEALAKRLQPAVESP